MLPNFMVIGAPRSGTTSLYEYLRAHPDIYMSPVKEPDFFAYPSLDAVHRPDPNIAVAPEEEARRKAALEADMTAYVALFEGANAQKRRGEASALYLGHPTAPEHIRRYIPDAKLIAILRNPSERIHSHYIHDQRIRAEYGNTTNKKKEEHHDFHAVVERAFREGFSEPATNAPEVWVRSGFYYKNLTRFRSFFPQAQLKIFLYEDLVRDANTLMADIFRFLDVDDSFVLPTTEAFNASVVPRNRRLFRFFTTRNPVMQFARALAPAGIRAAAMRTRNRVLADSKPTLDPELSRKLISIYRDDIQQLQTLLNRDLSTWLKEPSEK